jgi:transcriptional regulator with XRE-family HTH domain
MLARNPHPNAPQKKLPKPVDVEVGNRIRLRRQLLRMSQEKLGEGLGITFQQIQKYEKGTNRVGASRLHAIAKILDVPPSYFFGDTEAAEQDKEAVSLLGTRDAFEMARAYERIADPHVRKSLLSIVKVAAGIVPDAAEA